MNKFAPWSFNFPIHLSVMIFPAGERCVTQSQKRLRRRLYNFNECVFVIIWQVVPLSDLFIRIISGSMARKIGRVTFFEDRFTNVFPFIDSKRVTLIVDQTRNFWQISLILTFLVSKNPQDKRDYSHSREYFDISSNPYFKCFLYFPRNSV